VSPSIVYVSNELGSGSGVVIDGGYVVTNLHVIVPFSAVNVTPPAGEEIRDVPVVGVDFAADLALLGPIDADLPPIVLGTTAGIENGEDVYLVGYPSETEPSPTPTIAEGIVSRLRRIEDWDQTYVQTDADIAGGQSGGALVDDHGLLLGISGLSLDEAFALAISTDDVASRLEDLKAGGDDWSPLPDDGTRTGKVKVPSDAEGASLELLPEHDDGDVTLQLTTEDDDDIDDVAMLVYLTDGTSYASENADLDEWYSGGEEEIRPSGDGTYTFHVDADVRGWINLADTDGRAVTVSYDSSRALAALPELAESHDIEVGDEVEGIIEPLELDDEYVLDLDRGQRVRITATTGASDVAFTVLQPGEEEDFDSFYVDDSFIGVAGLDATTTYVAKVSGKHRILVIDNFGQGAYRLSVEKA